MEDLDSRLDKSNFDPMQSTFFSVASIARWWIVVAIIAMGPRLP
jgi:hypothetical protein